MTTRLDGFFSDLIGSEFVKSDENRFEWCKGYLETKSGEIYKISIPCKGGEIEEKMVFQYLRDNATDKAYIAYNPMDMGPQFLIGAIVTPFVLAGTLVVQTAKLAFACLKVIYHVFQEVYEKQDDEDLLPLFLRSFEKSLELQKQEITAILEEAFASIQYAIGLEAAAIYGTVYCNDPETVAKMQVIWAEIEKKWNHEVDYHDTPTTYAINLKKNLEKGCSVQEAVSDLDWEKMEPSFYMLQCYQEREAKRIQEVGPRYPSYEAMQESIKEEAREHAQKMADLKDKEGL